MKRKDLFQLVGPLSEKLYQFAYALIPDDLQAEQLIIDGFNAFLLKEKNVLKIKEVDFSERKDVLLNRKQLYKLILTHIGEIGIRRSGQLMEQMKLNQENEYSAFYSLGAKERATLYLRYDAQFNVDEIEEILVMPRFEVIEKLHNGRFLLLNGLSQGATL